MATVQRNSSIEILRVFFMILILVIHVYYHGSGQGFELVYSLGKRLTTAWNLSLFNVGMLGVTGFMFISGYFGIRTNRKSLSRILGFPFFYALILGIIFKHCSLRDIFYLLFAFNGWWFVSCYLFIMLLAPFIEGSIKKTSERNFFWLLMGMFVYTYLMRFLSKDNSHDIIFLLSVYMGGCYMRLFPMSGFARMARKIGGGGIFALILIPVLMAQIKWQSDKFLAYFIQNILLFIVSYWLVYQCEHHVSYNKYINNLAKGTLSIYLITDYPNVRNVITPWLLPFLLKGYGLVLIVMISIVILFVDLIRGRFFEWFYNKIKKLRNEYSYH